MYMAFSPAFGYLGVVFKNGLTMLLDRGNFFKPVLKIEDEVKDKIFRSGTGSIWLFRYSIVSKRVWIGQMGQYETLHSEIRWQFSFHNAF